MPSVSVIITTQDRPQLVLHAIQSVIAQDHVIHQIIIVDDGSKENIEVPLESLQLSHLEYYRFPRPHGANAARNLGIEKSTGDYIAFLDDDDQWESSKISSQINAFQKIGAVFSYTGIHNLTPEGKTIKKRFYPTPTGSVFTNLMKDNFIGSTSSIVVDRSFINQHQIRFDETLPSMQDYDFYLSVFSYTNLIAGVPQFLVRYRQERSLWTDKTSSNFLKFKTAKEILYKKYETFNEVRYLNKSLRIIQLKKCVKYPKFLLGFLRSFISGS